MSNFYLNINKDYCINCIYFYNSPYSNGKMCTPDFDVEEIPKNANGDCILFIPKTINLTKIDKITSIKKDLKNIIDVLGMVEDENVAWIEKRLIKIHNDLIQYLED
jgi:hypothetical protein